MYDSQPLDPSSNTSAQVHVAHKLIFAQVCLETCTHDWYFVRDGRLQRGPHKGRPMQAVLMPTTGSATLQADLAVRVRTLLSQQVLACSWTTPMESAPTACLSRYSLTRPTAMSAPQRLVEAAWALLG